MGCCVSSNHNRPPTKSESSQESEEETVKEVLSETPTIRNYTTPENNFKNSSPMEEKKKPIMGFNDPNDDEQVSDITLSESISTTTEKRYTPEDDRTQVRQRSPAMYRNPRDRSVGSSPARRSDPSPGRGRFGPGRDSRKDSGECSGRRSRSPAMRAENVGRSPSVRKTGKSPCRVRSELGDRIRKMDERDHNNGENEWPPTCENESLENPLVSLECFIFL